MLSPKNKIVFVSIMVGAICGSIMGAVFVAATAWFSPPAPPSLFSLGSGQNWVGAAFVLGGLLSIIPSAILGFAIGRTSASKPQGLALGLILGLFVVLYLLANRQKTYFESYDTYNIYADILVLPLSGFVGFIIASITSKLADYKARK